ncbi:obscurin-like protein 1a [Aplochiton taeniatus]
MDVFGGAPRVLGYPRPMVSASGAQAVLRCQIGGDPRPEVAWERKSQPISAGQRHSLWEEGTAYCLAISQVTADDSGQYICRARNSVGETYAAATLRVEGPLNGGGDGEIGKRNGEIENGKRDMDDSNGDFVWGDRPSFLIKPLSLRVDRGEDAAFSCKLWAGAAPPQVLWEKDGRKLGDVFESAHYSTTNQDGGWVQLRLFRTRLPDAGVYTCRATNQHGEALAAAVLLVEPVPQREEKGRSSASNGLSDWSPRQQRHSRHASSSSSSHGDAAKAKRFSVSEGKHAKFRCAVTGKPKPEIVWKKDGAPLVAGRRHLIFEDREGYYTLKVMYCKAGDSGLYVCAASNALGHTLSAVHLSVQGPPVRFKRALQDVEVKESDVAVLECEVPDGSVPTAWYLEDQRLAAGGRYGMEQSGTQRRLTIRDVVADDDGVYLCEMADGGRSIAELAVKGPIVRKLPRKVEVSEGENAVFCVEVEQDDVEVQWFKDGLKLLESSQTIVKAFGKTHILVFVNVAHQDTGVVTFVVGRSTTSSRLKVKAARHSPPVCPVDVQMDTDRPNSVLLSWAPAPNAPVATTRCVYVVERQEVGSSQEWQRCLTSDATATTSTAEVSGDSVPYEGKYRFRVCCVNKYGRSGHVEFPQTVQLVPGPKILRSLQGCEVVEGEEAGFSIQLSTSLTGTWFLNSTQLQPGARCSMRQEQRLHTLVIHDTRLTDDEAEVTFIANGVRDSAVLRIKPAVVNFLPLSEHDSQKRVESGGAVVLYCEVTHQSGDVRWFKDGAELQESDGLTIQSEGNMRRIIIQSAEATDSGAYTCQTANDVVRFNVEVEEGDLTIFSVAGETVALHCDLTDADAQVYWYHDDEQIFNQPGVDFLEEGQRRTLLIQSAESSQTGVYTCRSADDVIAFRVKVKGPAVWFSPVPKEDLCKTSVELDPVVLSCHVSREDAQAMWYKDGVEVSPGDGVTLQADGTLRRLIIRSAESSDAGSYTCRAGGDNSVEFTVKVTEPPVLIVDPTHDQVLDRYTSEQVVLQVELSRSNGSVHWCRDGVRVGEGSEEEGGVQLTSAGPYRRLTIPSATKEHAGEYVCDTEGDTVFFQLSITDPPVRIISPDQPETLLTQRAGERLELRCVLSAAAAPVRWYRDGLQVEQGPLLELEAHGAQRSLVLPDPTAHDTAEYVCDTEDDSVAWLVTVTEPPVQLSRPSQSPAEALEVRAGEPLVLEVQVSRSDAVVTWRSEGREVEESDEVITVSQEGLLRRLTIHNPMLRHSGKYTCDAVDDQIHFQVKVSEAPVYIVRRSEVKTELRSLISDDIVLECELSRPNAVATWHRDGRRIQGDDERFCEEEEGAFRSLVILNAELEDSGEYVLQAGEDHSITFHVTVREPPVSIVGNSQDPDYQDMVAGDNLILACEVSRSSAPVRWLCNERVLSADCRTQVESYGTLRKLIVSAMQPSDSGKYICDASDDKMVIMVRVKEPPVTFIHKEENKVVIGYEAEGVSLTGVVSKERAVVRWLKDWTPLDGERFRTGVDGNTRLLTIEPLRRSDAGEYTCDANTDQIHFSLLVKEMRVRFVKPLVTTQAHKDGMVTLCCEVCKPKADVQWLRDGVEVVPSRRFTVRADGVERSLTIHRLTTEDAGEYACESRDDRTAAWLTVDMPRVIEFVTELHNTTVLEGEDATFKCVVSPDDVQLVWQMDGEPLALGDRFQATQNGLCHTLLIRACTMLDCSRITAEAEGSTSKATLKVQEAQVTFTKRAEAATGEEFGDATMETEVSLETAEVQWIRSGVVIQPGPRHALGQEGRTRSLTVRSLTLSDRGTYRCETLHDRTHVKLNVEPRKIAVRKPLCDTETFEKEAASFEVELSHTDVEGVWQKDGLRLKPNNQWRVSTNGRVHGLTLSNLSVEDTGTIVFSAEGLRTSARLTVKETPVALMRKMVDVRMEEGFPATLECEFSRQNVEVKWFKDGVELRPGKNHRIYSLGRKKFCQVLLCSVADSGSYSCDTGDISTEAKLDVYEPELEVVCGLEDLRVPEEENAVFMCEVSLQDVPGDWYKDGHKIRPTSTVKTRTEGTKHFLLMCNVKAEDSGEIRFVAKQAESRASLVVEELPVSIVKPLRDRTALENHRVILECTASTPRCEVTWYRGDHQLASSDRLEIRSDGCCHKLTIQQVVPEDEGLYSVRVGEHTTQATLLVEGQSLVMVRALSDVEVSAPEPACFQCEVSVSVDKAPVWILNGEQLHPGPAVRLQNHGTVHKLTLNDTSASMSGTVRFTLGKAKSSAALTVHGL